MKETLYTRYRNTVEPMMVEEDRKATLPALHVDTVDKAVKSHERNVVLDGRIDSTVVVVIDLPLLRVAVEGSDNPVSLDKPCQASLPPDQQGRQTRLFISSMDTLDVRNSKSSQNFINPFLILAVVAKPASVPPSRECPTFNKSSLHTHTFLHPSLGRQLDQFLGLYHQSTYS